MIRKCIDSDFDVTYFIINDASSAYKGAIPEDCRNEPYMSKEELKKEIDCGVVFFCFEENGIPVGVMGIQHVQDVTLFRHAYVLTEKQSKGIGGKLLSFLRKQTDKPGLIGTWADAVRAVRFYQKHGFRMVSPEEKKQASQKILENTGTAD